LIAFKNSSDIRRFCVKGDRLYEKLIRENAQTGCVFSAPRNHILLGDHIRNSQTGRGTGRGIPLSVTTLQPGVFDTPCDLPDFETAIQKRIPRRGGIIIGTLLFGSFAFQTMALLYTTASNTAFLTGLNVVLVPIAGAILLKQSVNRSVKLGIILAAAGLYLLCTNGGWSFNKGDVLAMLCAICIALHLIFTGKFARTNDVYWLTTIQIGIVALFSTLIAKLGGNEILVWQ